MEFTPYTTNQILLQNVLKLYLWGGQCIVEELIWGGGEHLQGSGYQIEITRSQLLQELYMYGLCHNCKLMNLFGDWTIQMLEYKHWMDKYSLCLQGDLTGFCSSTIWLLIGQLGNLQFVRWLSAAVKSGPTKGTLLMRIMAQSLWLIFIKQMLSPFELMWGGKHFLRHC